MPTTCCSWPEEPCLRKKGVRSLRQQRTGRRQHCPDFESKHQAQQQAKDEEEQEEDNERGLAEAF